MCAVLNSQSHTHSSSCRSHGILVLRETFEGYGVIISIAQLRAEYPQPLKVISGKRRLSTIL